MAFFDAEKNHDEFIELEIGSCEFMNRSRILTKQRKTWKGRKMPQPQRDKKNEEKEIQESLPQVPRMRLKKGNELMEIEETTNGVTIPHINPIAEFLFFYCPHCKYHYNDCVKHAKDCKGPQDKEKDWRCPCCLEWDDVETHICQAPIEKRPNKPWLAKGGLYGKTDWEILDRKKK
jgi:hypothetical protein